MVLAEGGMDCRDGKDNHPFKVRTETLGACPKIVERNDYLYLAHRGQNRPSEAMSEGLPIPRNDLWYKKSLPVF
jgi:hypothetical protein